MIKALCFCVLFGVEVVAAAQTPTSAQAAIASEMSVALYGNRVSFASLANTKIGPTEYSSRFVAPQSGRLAAFRKGFLWYPGYGGPNPGLYMATLQTDSGAAAGHVPSGQVIAVAGPFDVRSMPSPYPNAIYAQIPFMAPALVTAGNVYHLVIVNIAPNTDTQYDSINDLYDFCPEHPPERMRGNEIWDARVLIRLPGAAWNDHTGGRDHYTAMAEYLYVSGVVFGVGYVGIHSTASADQCGGAKRMRQIFQPTTPLGSTTRLWLKLIKKASGGVDDSLTITVLRSTSLVLPALGAFAGTPVAQSVLRHGALPVGGSKVCANGSAVEGIARSEWYAIDFDTPFELVEGSVYAIEMESQGGTYQVPIARDGNAIYPQGSAYSFAPTTTFSDGWCEYTNGGGWTAGETAKIFDMSFFFEVSRP